MDFLDIFNSKLIEIRLSFRGKLKEVLFYNNDERPNKRFSKSQPESETMTKTQCGPRNSSPVPAVVGGVRNAHVVWVRWSRALHIQLLLFSAQRRTLS